MAGQAFERFDQHEAVVRTVPAEVWTKEGGEVRAAFEKSLGFLTDDPRVLAVFAALDSAPFWQLLRDRGGLSGPEARAALTWMLETLLAALRNAALPRRRAES
jgi:hypothetical protein